MQKRQFLIGALAVAALGAWYAFRPERLFINQTVSESLSDAYAAAPAGTVTAEPVALAVGRFHSVAHETMGQAAIYQLPNGKRVLRFTEFATSNGPDVQIYLVATTDASDDETVTRAGFVNVGAMKGNQGDQNYELPDDLDLTKYRAVTVWCRRFGVNFGTAPLGAPAAATPVAAEVPPATLASGRFHSNAHETTGNATILQLENGTRVLRLTNFTTSNGPDVRVYLVAASDVTDDATVKTAGFIDLGAMKGNRGDQNYLIPTSVDLGAYRTVTIWCRRFGVNFGSSPLQAGGSSAS